MMLLRVIKFIVVSKILINFVKVMEEVLKFLINEQVIGLYM